MSISIHAAREGGDSWSDTMRTRTAISIHAAREGGDSVAVSVPVLRKVFQSTPPVKAATFRVREYYAFPDISIHAAREGGDFGGKRNGKDKIYFNPRRP